MPYPGEHEFAQVPFAASLLVFLLGACSGGGEATTSLSTVVTTTEAIVTTTAPTTTTASTTTTAAPTTTAPAGIVIRVEGGQVVEGPDVISVAQGETVSFTVVGDAADEIHVHGYDLTFALEPGVPTTVEFVADATGIFEIELHESGALLTELEVTP